MQIPKKKAFIISSLILLILTGTAIGVYIFSQINSLNDNSLDSDNPIGFPDFITKNEDYFITRIGEVPQIDSNTYRLKVYGQIETPHFYTLTELQALDLIEIPLTTECIGNQARGRLLSTAIWKGFKVYDLLDSLGIKSNATGVKYLAADGYYVYHTIEQLINNGTIGALYMNNEILPPVQGFPLRIVNPGSYGAKQPAWVTEMEVIDKPINDYWDDRGWDTSPPMPVDSTIFFPGELEQVDLNSVLRIGGAAFGGTRISKVEFTLDRGITWNEAEIIKSIDLDNVWVFWEVNITLSELGTVFFNVKATDINNNTQPMADPIRRDGINRWPLLSIEVI